LDTKNNGEKAIGGMVKGTSIVVAISQPSGRSGSWGFLSGAGITPLLCTTFFTREQVSHNAL